MMMEPATKQGILREVTRHILNIFNERGVKYWIDFGTLLGCQREGDIIEWDNDADFSFMQEDVAEAWRCIPEILAHPLVYWVRSFHLGGTKVEGQGWFIDFYTWNDAGDKFSHTQPESFGIPHFPRREYDNGFEFVDFIDTKARIPVDWDCRLTRLYGDYSKPAQPSNGKDWWSTPGSVAGERTRCRALIQQG